MNIMFWNTNISKSGNVKATNIDNCLLNLTIENNVDLLILAEYGESIGQLCGFISNLSGIHFIPIPSTGGCTKIKGIINGKYNIQTLHEHDRYQIVKISTVFYDLIVAMIHNDSKLYSRDNRQEESLRRFHHAILEEQENHNCENIMAIGDYNTNPFEDACLSSGTLFALPFADEVIKSPTRGIAGKKYHKFYNPTWKFFGNRCIPYTTFHYFDSKDMANCYWNVIDQVMIRPNLVKAFDDDKLKIISSTKKHQLLHGGKPDKRNFSDHLPLYCVLKEDLI